MPFRQVNEQMRRQMTAQGAPKGAGPAPVAAGRNDLVGAGSKIEGLNGQTTARNRVTARSSWADRAPPTTGWGQSRVDGAFPRAFA